MDAKVFETWTVLPHEPIRKHTENFWSVPGSMPDPKIKRVMSLARLADGRIVIHNAVALEESAMKEIEAWGTPAVLAVPSGFHRQDAKIWKARYPSLFVTCPKGARKRVEQVIAADDDYDAAPKDATVQLVHLEGCPPEGTLEVRSEEGRSLAFSDAICNTPKTKGMTGFFLAPTGRPSVPRVIRWLGVKDKSAFRGHLERLAADDLRRVLVGHGAMIEGSAAETLRSVAAGL